jgi:diguanylate cyclase (GGDEF)-like protein
MNASLPNITVKPKRFFSLKWKLVIAISLILIFINGLLSLITYSGLTKQFTFQQSELFQRQKHENNKLIEQVYQRLENTTELLPLLANNDQQKTNLVETIETHWGMFQLSFDLQAAELRQNNGEIIGYWGQNVSATTDALYHQVISDQQPVRRFICRTDCQFYLATPILDNQGNMLILTFSQSIADWLLKLKSATNADTGLLSIRQDFPNHPGNALGDKVLPEWQAEVIGLTNAETNLSYLRQHSLAKDLNNSVEQNNYIKASNKNFNIQLIDLNNPFNPIYLVLINDITKHRNQINNSLYQAIITSIFGVIFIGGFISLALWNPIKQLTTLSKTLPLLATAEFSKVRSRLNRKSKRQFAQDELDNLDQTAFALTDQLESLQTEVKIREKALIRNALFDELTDLANRRLLLERIESGLKDIKRSNKQLAVLFIDLDQFKRINDSLGHEQGDQLLIEVSHRLRKCIRNSDTIARIGGDEFTVLVNQLDDTLNASSIAMKILEQLRIPVQLAQKEVIVTSSIGIAVGPENGTDAETLIRNADLAMYKAKGLGRDNYHYYTESMNTEAQEQLALENELRYAVEHQEFVLYYQPQIDLKSGQIIGAEALLRWLSPNRGLVSPFVFMDVLEDSGLIVPLGEQILDMACQQASQWSQLNNTPVKVAVNLSARQFNEPQLAACIAEILDKNNLSSRYLELEITESMLMDNIEDTIDTLKRLKKLGLTLSIDDFGTGYSSLSYLKQFPVDILKVDREFVKDIPYNSSDMAITSAVIAMAHKLNLKVVAEGIETEDQVHFLNQNHCEIGQGFYYSKPLPAKEISQILNQQINYNLPLLAQ